MRSLIVLSVLLLSTTLSSAAAAGHSQLLIGGYTPITNLSDHKVQHNAKFAVDQYNKLLGHPKLKLISVVSGETQLVEGTNYRLIIEAAPIHGVVTVLTEKYEVIVYDKLDGSRKLISFKKVNSVVHTSVLTGGYTPANVSDHKVQENAKFAVHEYNTLLGHPKLKLIRVVSAETQVVAGVNYRLIIEAVTIHGGVPENYEFVVYDKLDGSRKLISFKKVNSVVHSSVSGSLLIGGYTPITNLSDKVVQDNAKFAVHEHNKLIGAKRLKLIQVVSGEIQVVNGWNYRLRIEATQIHEAVPEKYEVIVYVENDGNRKLTSFVKVKN